MSFFDWATWKSNTCISYRFVPRFLGGGDHADPLLEDLLRLRVELVRDVQAGRIRIEVRLLRVVFDGGGVVLERPLRVVGPLETDAEPVVALGEIRIPLDALLERRLGLLELVLVTRLRHPRESVAALEPVVGPFGRLLGRLREDGGHLLPVLLLLVGAGQLVDDPMVRGVELPSALVL
jgi:hypothetical protein